MRGELVAIDLESTGLNVNTDKIIEVGAVRLKDGKIVDEYSTMVNPGIPIPTITTHITGIQQEDVAHAPTIDKVLPDIIKFVGDAVMIAHNVTLDMGFLQDTHGILRANKSIDTYDLATILLPGAPRYNLNSLTTQVGIELENAHRALDDAKATALLYWALWERILKLPHSVVQEISAASANIEWGTSLVFTMALRESTTSSREATKLTTEQLFEPDTQQHSSLKPGDTQKLLSKEGLETLLADDGAFADLIPNYLHRPQQEQMALEVADAFNTHRPVMIEADTGTGKSLAYLLPAALWAKENGERVVISTNTLNLQDQIIHKDVPIVKKALGFDLNVAVMKGRDNYLCPRRLATMRRRKPNNPDEARTLAKILVWLTESQSGDRSELNLRSQAERNIWQRLSAQDEGCATRTCETLMQGRCPFYKARKTAAEAHLVIVNHALLVADAKTENQVIPEYRYLIVDEAHQLEDAITHSLTVYIDEATLQRRLSSIGTPQRGLFKELLDNLRGNVPEKDYQRMVAFATTVSDATSLMDTHIHKFFQSILSFLNEIQEQRSSEYVTLVRIDGRLRNRGGFGNIQASWRTLVEFFDVIGVSMERLTKALNKFDHQNIPNYHDLHDSTQTAANYFAETRASLDKFILEPDGNMIYWLTVSQGSNEPSIQMAPLHIGSSMENYLWSEKESVVLTSATLRSQGSFGFIKDRLYANSIKTLDIPSVFDYKKSTLIYLPDDIPEPNQKQAYQKAVERGIIELAAALDGRVMVLFTSYSQLRQTSQAISPRLMLGNITLYDQSDGTSREALLEGFKSTDKAVLMGTKSFWEGIDVPGDSLSALIIVRLPFAVPSDPIFAARSESYPNSFNDYAVPDATLRFRQGFGRLIRTLTDRGVFTVFDSRVITKKYGANFLESLPDCTTETGNLEQLPIVAKKWLERD
ncbi:MAG: helicase C-terminal domain-containing protein [Aggregatilineales bacterium]